MTHMLTSTGHTVDLRWIRHEAVDLRDIAHHLAQINRYTGACARPYSVAELVGDELDAKRYEGGYGCVVYLSPRDYHRVHAPVAGKISLVRSMEGDYYPVNAMGVRYVHNLFVRNRRVAIVIDTPPESGLGRVTVVMVAAMVVGRITVSGIDARDVPFGVTHLSEPLDVKRGDEIGIFRLGSTAVVFFEPGVISKWVVGEGPVRFGQPFAEHTAETR